MNKELKYILLPTEKESPIWITSSNGKANLGKSEVSTQGVISQYLYILSDDEIKEGDWVYDSFNKSILIYRNGLLYSYKKIIATTNPELHFELNNCDGCQAGIPIENGNLHRMGKGSYPDFMGCTKDRYNTQGIPSISNEPIILPDGTKLQSDIEYIISLYNGKSKEVDVDNYVKEQMIGVKKTLSYSPSEIEHLIRETYKDGLQYNADKKFTLEDMRNFGATCYNKGQITGYENDSFNKRDKWIEDKIEPYKEQPKSDTVMVEVEFTEDVPSKKRYKLKDGCISIVR